jgi:hypothetical protein
MLGKTALTAAILLAGCGTAEALDTSYHGKDAGALVFAVGTLDQGPEVDFFFRKVGHESPLSHWLPVFDGVISYKPGTFFHTPDFTGHEEGDVKIDYLKPGDYEIFGYRDPMNGVRPSDTSIPFTIRAGQTTYIGDFAGLTITRLGFLDGPVDGVAFVISDKHERDLAIAGKKDPQLPPATLAVPDTSKLGDHSILATEPP